MSDPLVQVINLHKHFKMGPQDIDVLKGIDLEIPPGELLTIVGASGAGKSTLLHILGGLDRPSSGRVLFGGSDLSQLSDQKMADFRNQKIGFVFQFHHLLPEFTALENTVMPALIHRRPMEDIKKRASDILNDVGLGDRILHRPGELSGGEQQRVALARALMMDPKMILADEPTGNLDTHTSDSVFSLLKSIQKQKGLTLVLVTHNESLARQADRIVKIVDGKIEKA